MIFILNWLISKDSINNATMRAHPYIELIVSTKLEPSVAHSWLEAVRSTLPSGIVGHAEIIKDGKPKQSSFYAVKEHGDMHYVVPLTRDPNVAEVQKVAVEWNKHYVEGDFEIDYSNAGELHAEQHEIHETALREVAMEAAKINHTEWITEMSQKGWRYGTKFSQHNKENPMLMPWERLSPRYQLQELRRFDKLVEVLDRMQLQLVRKRR